MKTRTEKDPLGEKQVPADALYGIQTLRAAENSISLASCRSRRSLMRGRW